MDIAALAGISRYSGLKEAVGTAVTKLAMDQSKTQAMDLIRLMENSVNPNVGATVDFRV